MAPPESVPMNRIRRFLGLPAWQQRQIFSAWWLLLGFWVALRVQPFKSARRFAEIPLGPQTETTDVDAIAWCVRAASGTHVVPVRCLERSLTLQRVLRKRGVAAELRIGVEKKDSKVAGHAWLEIDGEPVGEPEGIDEKFAALVRS